MGREQAVALVGVQWVHDKHVRGRRIVLRRVVVDAFGADFQLLQRVGQPVGIAADFGPALVGLVFARAADGHLHKDSCQRRQDHHGQHADDAQRVVAVVAEEQGEVRQHGNRTRHRGGDRHDQCVAVAHMGQLVGHHARDLAFVHQLHQPGGGRDGGVLRPAPSGEGIRLRVVDHIDARHRQAIARGQLLHDAVECVAAVGDLARLVVAQHSLARIPPGEQVHARRDQKRDNHAGLARQQEPATHEDRRQGGQQKRGA